MNTTELATIKEDKRELEHIKNARLDDSLFSKELAPHYMQLATKLASSDLVPKSYRGKPQDLFICWAMGYQIGLSPEQAMQSIAVINGRPTMWGDDMLALCMAHKDFEDIQEEPILNADGVVTAFKCTVKRKGMSPKINVFSLDSAKKAGLLAKGGVWAQYPERMLKLRARGFSLRDAFPDALKGIKSKEEAEDYIDAEYMVVEQSKSRTEQLKSKLINNGQENDNNTKNNTIEIENQTVEPENAHTNDGASMATIGVEESIAPSRNRATETDKAIAQDRIDLIYKLLEEKCFTEERITKALKYYEVESFDEMTIEVADEFIKQLQKS